VASGERRVPDISMARPINAALAADHELANWRLIRT